MTQQVSGRRSSVEKVLTAAGASAVSLIRNGYTDDALAYSFKHIAKAVNAERVSLVKFRPENTLPKTETVFEWKASKAPVLPDVCSLDHLLGDPLFGSSSYDQLMRYNCIAGLSSDFPEKLQSLLAIRKSVAFLLLPVTVKDAIWGCIVIEYPKTDGDWSFKTAEALSVFTDGLGSAIGHLSTQKSEKKEDGLFEAVISSMSEGIMVLGSSFKVSRINPSAEGILGISHTEAAGLSPEDIFTGMGENSENATWFRQLVSTACQNKIIQVMTKNKEAKWLSINSCPLYISVDQPPQGVVISFADITSLKSTEAALRIKLQFERTIARISSQFINLIPEQIDNAITQALQDIAIEFNQDRAFVGLFRNDGGSVIDNIYEWHVPEMPPLKDKYVNIDIKQFPVLSRAFDERKPIYITDRDKLPDTDDYRATKEAMKTLNIRQQATAPMYYRGKLYGYFGFSSSIPGEEWNESVVSLFQVIATIFANVIEYQHIEEEIRENEDLFRTMFENSAVGMALVSPDGSFMKVNPALCKLTGHDEKSLLSIQPSQMGYPEDASVEQDYVTDLINGKITNYRIDKRIYHKKGHLVWVGTHVSLIRDDAGKPVYFIAHVQDITQAKEVDRMKTEFISLASHQLRTPLTAVKWYTAMLLKGTMGELNEKQHQAIYNVSRSNERMIQLVGSLLNISRIESGHIIVEPKPTDLNGLVNDILQELQPKLLEKQITPVVTIEQNLPEISIDPKLIRHVYMNLLTNAIKYSPPGGEVSITLSRQNDFIVSEVTDNGAGIPADAQDNVFHKFFRANNAIKMVTDGNGLGLYLTKAIVEESQGRIWFTSEEGKGSSFWFTLPVSGTKPKKGEVSLDG